jgi:hypothetical protein
MALEAQHSVVVATLLKRQLPPGFLRTPNARDIDAYIGAGFAASHLGVLVRGALLVAPFQPDG